ncbi:hypothetical protein CI109_107273 [Kwoniella shandongensis]|uniref:Cyclin-like domain-containing protein n=1 Tax=Kwoniella shandongensis TaxID=1734106 RepID=A0A5M6C2G6_9TREE|nr:uncharacterized protein CI109_002555 [Kwoniella shandongensis]KAA5529214.1 hypothetical protein CI109_002555 [Kwoniella shandongensis]
MSSSFWSSSHCAYWLVTRPYLAQSRSIDLRYTTPQKLYCLYIFFAQLIQKLGKRLLLRQIPIATACVFFKRFYLKNSICETNPYLVIAACLFVAAKVEETPVHIKSVVSEAKVVFAEHGIKMFPAEPNKVGEMEFYLLEDLDFHLVVFHPYRALLHITGREPADAGRFRQTRLEEDIEIKRKEAEAKKTRDEEVRKAGAGRTPIPPGQGAASGAAAVVGAGMDEKEEGESEEARIRRLMGRGTGEGMMEIDEGVLQISWFLLNDTYRTDVHLLYPPYIIALSAIYIAFCLTSMNNSSSSTRTRTSSSQIHNLSTSMAINDSLDLPPPPSSTAEFLASFQVSLPTLFACVQEIVSLYPVWEGFEPTSMRQNGAMGAGAAAGQRGASQSSGSTTTTTTKKEKFGPEEAEALVRRMIEGRMVDIGHPDNAGKSERSASSAGSGSGNGSTSGVGKKRGRA